MIIEHPVHLKLLENLFRLPDNNKGAMEWEVVVGKTRTDLQKENLITLKRFQITIQSWMTQKIVFGRDPFDVFLTSYCDKIKCTIP